MQSDLKILIAGGSGLIGRSLSEFLHSSGHQVCILSRTKHSDLEFESRYWDTEAGTYETDVLKDVGSIVNLCGLGIADKPWTAARKNALVESRTKPLQLLKRMLNECDHAVKNFVQSSAIGFYGDTGDLLVDEDSKPGNDFLASCTLDMEKEFSDISEEGLRKVALRIGPVFTLEGGMLAVISDTPIPRILFVMGSGRQMVSWIHIQDLCRAIFYVLRNEETKGIYNCVAPQPITHVKLIKTIKEVSKQKALAIRVPEFILKTVLGERSSVILNSNKVSSEKIIGTGFDFKFKDIPSCLEDLYGRT